MIKKIVLTTTMAMVLTGCVGTAQIVENSAKENVVRNAKTTKESVVNDVKKEVSPDTNTSVADEKSDAKAL